MSNASADIGWQAKRQFAALALLAISAFGAACVNVEADNGGFFMGGSRVVDEDEEVREDLVALGGSIRIDGRARRDVVVIGGTLTINGTVGRDVAVIGGSLNLGEDARIEGNATVVGGGLNRHPDAEIDGELVNVSVGPGFEHWFNWGAWGPVWWGGPWGFAPFGFIGLATKLMWWLLLALVTVAVVGDRVSSASHAVAREPLRLGAIGCVGAIALLFAFLVLLVLSVLIIGIPFLLALIFGTVLAYIFGIVAVFQAVGAKVMDRFGRPDASQIAIVLAGCIVLSILRYFPVIGGLMWLVVGFVGLGSVLATRFGTGQPWIRRRVVSPPPPPSGPTAPGGAEAPPSGAPAPEPTGGPAGGPAEFAGYDSEGTEGSVGEQQPPAEQYPAGDEPERQE